jgi:hypothetical protein
VKPVEVTWNPALTTGQDGKRYAISGNTWIEVPPETTFEDLPMYMVVKQREDIQQQGEALWQVTGSKGSSYTVSLRESQWSCTCAGFGWRRRCKHIDEKRVA